MRLAHITIVSGAAATSPTPATVADLIWVLTRPDEGVEHISVRPGAGAGRLDIGVFLKCGDAATVRTTAQDIVERALRQFPCLRPWSLTGARIVSPAELTPRIKHD